MREDRIHRTLADDGTQIAGGVHGQGPPLVLVPGGPADGETGWLSLLPHLTDHFTCYTVNTRGRGLSADHPDHTRERLVGDITAFVESIGDAVYLFGHSAGGAHALEAAAQCSAVHELALYEPTLTELAEPERLAGFEDAFVRIRRATEEGRVADAAQIFIDELALANDDERGVLAEVGAAEGMAPLVPLVVDEVVQSGLPALSDLELVERITIPVTILYGSHTHAFYVDVARYLEARLTDVRLREIPGPGHLGPELEPEPVAAALAELLTPTASLQRS